MVLFPNAKINVGLRILRRRDDGFHDIATVMMPVEWCDILEIVPARASCRGTFKATGNVLADCPDEKNLVIKALRAVERHCGTHIDADIYLHKVIPDGAGLGGGSSDAAFTITGLNSVFNLGLDTTTMATIAAEVGSDCPFFIYNRPMLATGRGTELSPAEICLDGVGAIALAKPMGEGVSTARAYAGVRPRLSDAATAITAALASTTPSQWRRHPELVNDFEASVFKLRPDIEAVKKHFYACGAEYAAMSGSGAAVYGLFANAKMAETTISRLTECTTFVSALTPCRGE